MNHIAEDHIEYQIDCELNIFYNFLFQLTSNSLYSSIILTSKIYSELAVSAFSLINYLSSALIYHLNNYYSIKSVT